MKNTCNCFASEAGWGMIECSSPLPMIFCSFILRWSIKWFFNIHFKSLLMSDHFETLLRRWIRREEYRLFVSTSIYRIRNPRLVGHVFILLISRDVWMSTRPWATFPSTDEHSHENHHEHHSPGDSTAVAWFPFIPCPDGTTELPGRMSVVVNSDSTSMILLFITICQPMYPLMKCSIKTLCEQR